MNKTKTGWAVTGTATSPKSTKIAVWVAFVSDRKELSADVRNTLDKKVANSDDPIGMAATLSVFGNDEHLSYVYSVNKTIVNFGQ